MLKSIKQIILIIIVLLVIGFLWLNLQEENYQREEIVNNQEVTKILFTFAAASHHQERTEIIRQNINLLASSKSPLLSIDCVVFSYVEYKKLPDWLKKMDQEGGFCRLVTIFKGTYTTFIKYLDPVFLESSGYNYVIFHMDDVRLYGPETNYNIEKFFQFIIKYNLGAASPSIIGTVWDCLRPNSDYKKEGRIVNAIEIQSTAFRVDVWKCYWDLNDSEFPHGWTDGFMLDYCFKQGRVKENTLMGIMNSQIVKHEQFPSTHHFDGIVEMRSAQLVAWEADRNISIKPYEPFVVGELS